MKNKLSKLERRTKRLHKNALQCGLLLAVPLLAVFAHLLQTPVLFSSHPGVYLFIPLFMLFFSVYLVFVSIKVKKKPQLVKRNKIYAGCIALSCLVYAGLSLLLFVYMLNDGPASNSLSLLIGSYWIFGFALAAVFFSGLNYLFLGFFSGLKSKARWVLAGVSAQEASDRQSFVEMSCKVSNFIGSLGTWILAGIAGAINFLDDLEHKPQKAIAFFLFLIFLVLLFK